MRKKLSTRRLGVDLQTLVFSALRQKYLDEREVPMPTLGHDLF